MTGVYDNKHFPLQTKIVLKFCSTCKKLKPFKQFNKCPWNTYFFRTYYKSCSHDKDEKRKKKSHKSFITVLYFYLYIDANGNQDQNNQPS